MRNLFILFLCCFGILACHDESTNNDQFRIELVVSHAIDNEIEDGYVAAVDFPIEFQVFKHFTDGSASENITSEVSL